MVRVWVSPPSQKTVELRARQAGQAKDIRMFHAAAFFGEMYKRAGDEKSVLVAKIQRKYRTGSIVRSVLGFLRDAGCYAYLIYLLYASKIGLGDFVFMIGIVINFSDNLAGVFMNLAAFTKDMISLRELKRLLKSPESGDVLQTTKDISEMLDAMEKRTGVHSVKILAKE